MTNYKISIKDLNVTLSGKKILKNINMNIKEGEFISILGESGSGKTTLLKTIAGIVKEESGRIIINDKDVSNVAIHKRNAVVVFQDFRLFPHMNVLENICFPMKMKKIAKQIRVEKAKILLEKVKLEGFENRAVNEISGGQIQRVAIARALAAEPDILLLDEPFSSLDTKLRKDMRELICQLQKEFNISTIFISHDKEEALQISDKIAYIKDGEILQFDTSNGIYKHPLNKKVSDFFCDATYLKGKVASAKFFSPDFEFDLDYPDGLYLCQLRNPFIRREIDENGDFILVSSSYLGHYYQAVLKSIKSKIEYEVSFDTLEGIELGTKFKIFPKCNDFVVIKENESM